MVISHTTLLFTDDKYLASRHVRDLVKQGDHKGNVGFDKQYYKFNLAQKPFLDMSQTEHSGATAQQPLNNR
jgi:hypothetical protein